MIFTRSELRLLTLLAVLLGFGYAQAALCRLGLGVDEVCCDIAWLHSGRDDTFILTQLLEEGNRVGGGRRTTDDPYPCGRRRTNDRPVAHTSTQ